jgi:hypothetical protein
MMDTEKLALHRHNTENSREKNSQKMKFNGYRSNSCIHVFVSDLNIPLIVLPILLQENWWTERGNT